MNKNRKKQTGIKLDKTANLPERLDCLDDQFVANISAICSAVLVRERIRSGFLPEEIAEVETVRDHCRLQLRDGRAYLARLDRNGGLLLDKIGHAC